MLNVTMKLEKFAILIYCQKISSWIFSARKTPSLGSRLHRVTQDMGLTLEEEAKTWDLSGLRASGLDFFLPIKPQRSALECSLSSIVFDMIRP